MVPRGRETFLLNQARVGGPMVSWRVQGAPSFLVNDPALAHEVLARRAGAFVNRHHPYAALTGSYTPAGAFALRLATHARERAAYGDAFGRFHAAAITAFGDLDGEVDLEARAKALLFSATVDLLLGRDLRGAADAYVAAVDVIEAELCEEPPPSESPPPRRGTPTPSSTTSARGSPARSASGPARAPSTTRTRSPSSPAPSSTGTTPRRRPWPGSARRSPPGPTSRRSSPPKRQA